MEQQTDNGLEKRHLSEIQFHDRKYTQGKRGNIYNRGFKGLIYSEFLEQIGDLANKKVLEFGCGNGWQTKILASRGAEVWAFDISEEALKNTRSLLENSSLSTHVHLDQMPAEKLSYPSETFDLVIGNAILHHLDLSIATGEIHRVLKKGGKAYFLEPLGHNPFINLFRMMTPSMRTADEKPLKFKDFNTIGKKFSHLEHQEYYCFTLLALFWHYLLKENSLFTKTRNFFFEIDSFLLKKCPFLRRYCWYTLLIMQK